MKIILTFYFNGLNSNEVFQILVVTVTFSYIWSMIRGRTWGHEGKVGSNFLLGRDKRGDIRQIEKGFSKL